MCNLMEDEKMILGRLLSIKDKKVLDDLYAKFGGLSLIIEKAISSPIKGISLRRLEILRDIPKLLEYYLLSSLKNCSRKDIKMKELIDYFKITLSHLKFETFVLSSFDSDKKFISSENIFRGSIDSATIYPRDLIEKALSLGASYVVFAHNHPSGIASASKEDIEITRKLFIAFKMVRVHVLDHIIIGGNKHFSFRKEGVLDSFLDSKEM